MPRGDPCIEYIITTQCDEYHPAQQQLGPPARYPRRSQSCFVETPPLASLKNYVYYNEWRVDPTTYIIDNGVNTMNRVRSSPHVFNLFSLIQ